MMSTPHRSHFCRHAVRPSELLTLFLVLLSCAGFNELNGATATLKPSQDTSLFESSQDNNLGDSDLAAGTTAHGKKSRALIKFDLSKALPANATITSAQLTVRVSKAPAGAVASTFGLHRLLKDWGEGSQGGLVGAPAENNEATWEARFFPDTLWSAPGAAAGTDYLPKASSTRLIGGVSNYTFPSSTDLVADVQSWINDPAGNFGWILVSQLENAPKTARRFSASEAPSQFPSLVIEYTEAAPIVQPSITTGPKDQTVQAGSSVSFNVVATGSTPLRYQWQFNGSDLQGQIAETLTLQNVQPTNAGAYRVLVSNAAGTATSAAATLAVNTIQEPGRRWTIMIYGSADHNLSPSLVADMQEMEAAGSSPDFNIVLQADFDATSDPTTAAGLPSSLAGGVTRFLIQQDSDPKSITSAPVERLPESNNMDDPAVLTEFINWAAKKYPADRYGLIMWDHGGQWQGFGGDSQDATLEKKGNLSTAQIRSAVSKAMQSSKISKWDFVAFDTCLMGGAEVLTDFTPLTDVFIACPEIDYGDGWDYAATFSFLKNNPTVGSLEFGRAEANAWQAHHMVPANASDLELAAHAVYDLTKYGDFEARFANFASQLQQASSIQSSILPQLRKQTTQYSLGGVKELGKPTDYIDLGELADRIAAEATTPPALKQASQDLAASIDAMVAAKIRGTGKQRTHGLSIYYPVDGSSNDAAYLGLTLSSKPGSGWAQLLANVSSTRSADTSAPDLEPIEAAASTFVLASAGFGRQAAAPASIPATFAVQVVDGADATTLFSSIVDNHFTSRTNEYVYLGEVSMNEIHGVGKYNVAWAGKLPTLSSPGSSEKAFLGAFFDGSGSDLMVSFANYTPPGSGRIQEVVLLTQFKNGSYKLIEALDGDAERSGLAPDGIDLLPGGTLRPVFYMEKREGQDPAKWEGDSIASPVAIKIPPTGLAGLVIEESAVKDSVYSLEVQVVDAFENESEVVSFAVQVGKAPESQSLSISTTASGSVQVAWPTTSSFVLESTPSLSPAAWSPVRAADIIVQGANKVYNFTPGTQSASQFFRLKQN